MIPALAGWQQHPPETQTMYHAMPNRTRCRHTAHNISAPQFCSWLRYDGSDGGGAALNWASNRFCYAFLILYASLHLIYVRTKQTRCAFIFFLHFLRKNKKSIWIAWALLLQLCASQSHWVHHRVLWHAQTTIEYAVSITPNGMICIVYSFWWRTGYLRVAVSLHASMHCALSKRRRTLKLPMTQKTFVHLF